MQIVNKRLLAKGETRPHNPFGYKLSALPIELNSSEASAGEESSTCVQWNQCTSQMRSQSLARNEEHKVMQ